MLIKTITPLLFFSCLGMVVPTWSADGNAVAESTANTASNTNTEDAAANNNAASCIDVVVNGERIPSYECLTQKLMQKDAGKPAPTPEMASQSIVGKPSNQLGLFNYTTTSNRMGNTFGTSVYPQRPPATPVAPVLPR